jgi:hypothetical protein
MFRSITASSRSDPYKPLFRCSEGNSTSSRHFREPSGLLVFAGSEALGGSPHFLWRYTVPGTKGRRGRNRIPKEICEQLRATSFGQGINVT